MMENEEVAAALRNSLAVEIFASRSMHCAN